MRKILNRSSLEAIVYIAFAMHVECIILLFFLAWSHNSSAPTDDEGRRKKKHLGGGGRRKSRQEENIEDHFNIIGFCGLLFV